MSLRQSANYVWSVSEAIGQGATGLVYIARNKNDGKPYAAKVFNMYVQRHSSQIRLRETALLRKLQHKNIVTMVAEETENGSKSTVLIMELCDASLYNVLELPENYYGVAEDEFKCVLRDVACGMKYLRENNVVHRDVKPGNILKKRSSTGGSIYKLTDFGAARQLNNADQSFMSIYGTEEYLHPDVYEKAIMKNFSRKKFTAAVDLWSLGVTFYHVATGQLPFRPYGGKQNKETMFEIISQKAPKVISGVQKSNGGRIEYDNDLPDETRISKGLKIFLQPMLQELLETNGEGVEELITFEQFYAKVEDITTRQVINVFALGSSTFHKIYMKKDERFEDLKSRIAFHTDVREEDQHLFLSKEEFCPSPNTLVHEFPETTRENPLIVLGGRSIPSAQLNQRKITNLPKMPSGKFRPENDVTVLKIYASMCYVYHFGAEELYSISLATQLAFETISLVMNKLQKRSLELHKSLGRKKKLIDRVVFRATKELHDLKSLHENANNVNSDSANLDSQRNALGQCQALLNQAMTKLTEENCKIPEIDSLEVARLWFDETKVPVNDVNEIFSDILKGKATGIANLDELIHIGRKQQMSESINTVKERFESLAKVRRDYHSKFESWLPFVLERLQDLQKTESALTAADKSDFEDIACRVIDQISAEKMKLFGEGSRKSDSGLTVIEAEVSTLEKILQDVVHLVEEGDQKLMSSKEIFEELSTCGYEKISD